jgi:hypothetical protein
VLNRHKRTVPREAFASARSQPPSISMVDRRGWCRCRFADRRTAGYPATPG